MSLIPDILECPSCSGKACRTCAATHTEKHKTQKPADFPNPTYSKCLLCNKIVLMKNSHRFMKELLFNLNFHCKNCKQDIAYQNFNSHTVNGVCQSAGRARLEKEESIAMVNPNQMQNISMIDALYIFERDTKYVHRFDLQNNRLERKTVQMSHNFPHNFQACYSPSKQLFLIGGGDFSQNQENLYKTTEIDLNTWQTTQRCKLRFPRHGHSCCAVGSKFIICTGSRKDNDDAHKKCEQYNIGIDIWFDAPDLNEGRHYHASCAFKDRFVYVFCGIKNATKKYVNTIERLDTQNLPGGWELIQPPKEILSERQGLGCAQMGPSEILIFGGFSGRFLSDSMIFNCNTKELKKTSNQPKNEIFSFQMPTVYEPSTRTVLSADWQRMKVVSYAQQSWSVVADLK